MINILVPTDFSALSKVAIEYAINFANNVEGSITLVHVVTLVKPARASTRTRVAGVEKEILQIAESDIEKLASSYAGILKVGPLKTRVVKGSVFNETVQKEAKRLKASLIIMGTKGASGLKKYVMGSNTTAVIDAAKTPVLVVPELARFRQLRNVVYATDLQHTEKELKTLLPYFRNTEMLVHLIHVASSARQVSLAEKSIDAIIVKRKYSNVIVRVLVNKNIGEAIDQYITTVKADILATFTHDYSFYEKLFDRSITRKIAFQSKIPLLAFKQK